MGEPCHRVFVCTRQRKKGCALGCCANEAGREILCAFRKALSACGLGDRVELVEAGCQGNCKAAPCVRVYPEGIAYGHLTPGDVPTIVREHLLAGHEVARLTIDDRAAPKPCG